MTSIACVTGAGRGLGLHLTREMLERGHTVFAGEHRREESGLDELEEQYAGLLHRVPLDIGDDESVAAAGRQIAAKTGHVDILYNNAGIIKPQDYATLREEMDMEAMAGIFNVNTLGTLRVTRALLPLLLQGERRLVVNISSEAGSIARNSRTSMYGYCMSKAALNMQSSLVHQELKPQGGAVMVFHPGWMRTFMNGEPDPNAPVLPEEAARKIAALVERRGGERPEQPLYLDLEGEAWPW
ncbi:SDR family oxidoreductase [Paenibacillus spiritus]|uniref:SDR family oxidoreductase n=1 Tax=Paenibacillus spiritus TaxID=2496557 RepID=A0A5J5FVG8_9BACL|nr:SDR family oxidoreductase [Paenibacillus spiritus]KAA8997210.1 SDR family oxidoreductase [Paenibacillus spiritus]